MNPGRARRAGWVALGAALGGLTAAWNVRRGHATASDLPAATSPAAVTARRASRQCPDPPEVAQRAAEVSALAKRADDLFAANATAHFSPPANLPTRFSGGAIGDAVKASVLAAGVDAEVLATDCSEYPCLVTARAHSAADMQKIKDRFFEQPSYGEDIKQLTRARTEDPREYRFGVTVYPASDPRLGEILAALGRRLGVARLGPGARDPEAPPFAPETLGAAD